MSSVNGNGPPAIAPGPWMRNPELETQFFDHVVRAAGLLGSRAGEVLVRDVGERLAKGAREYGDLGYLTADLATELLQEPADILGWSVLAYQRLYLDEANGMPADTAAAIREELVEMSVAGAKAWIAGQRAKALWAEFAATRR